MKLILAQEVEGLGAPGDIVEVKDGYGRNYLVPRGLAIGWTRGAEKQIQSIKRARDARAIQVHQKPTFAVGAVLFLVDPFAPDVGPNILE